MPWTPETFRSRHNKKLSRSQAAKAAKIANALLRKGHDEASAIRIANSRVAGKPTGLSEMVRRRKSK